MSATAVPTQVKVGKTPEPPTFATPAEERLHRKQRLASAFRLFAKFGFSEGVAGHITARDPEKHDHFWVNPFGMHFAHIRASDLVLVNEKRRSGRGRPADQRSRICHPFPAAHGADRCGGGGPCSFSIRQNLGTMGRLLDPLTQDACAFYDDHAVFSDYTGVVYDMSEGDRIAEALGHRKAVILQNHGTLTVGRTVDEAAWYFITMERSCQVQLMAEAAGKPIPISHEAALVAQKQVGNPRIGVVPISAAVRPHRSRAA